MTEPREGVSFLTMSSSILFRNALNSPFELRSCAFQDDLSPVICSPRRRAGARDGEEDSGGDKDRDGEEDGMDSAALPPSAFAEDGNELGVKEGDSKDEMPLKFISKSRFEGQEISTFESLSGW